MQIEMDKIQFESRREIEDVAVALITFRKEHPESREIDTVGRLIDLLEAMHMQW